MGAKINNTAKRFQFNVLIPGFNPFLCQKAKTPEVELDVAEHGDAGFKVKTAAMKNIGNLTLERIFSTTEIDRSVELWMESIMNTTTGGGLPPSAYKKTIVLQQYGADNISIVAQYVCEGAWPCKRNGLEFDRTSSENTTESLEFCLDDLKLL